MAPRQKSAAPRKAEPPQGKSPAALACETVIGQLIAFERQLDAGHEMVIGSAGSEAGILHIERIGAFAPDFVLFHGRDEAGMKTQLIQHYSQMSVMLRAVPKPRPDAPARRIGFLLASGWTGGESGDGSFDPPPESDPDASP